MPAVRRTATVCLLAGSLIAGCRHPAQVTTASSPAWPTEERCWWAPFRTALPTDSVAARYARAYTTVGLSRAEWSHLADTAWAQAGPSMRTDSGHVGTYAARVVALRRGDSTLFRTFVSVRASTSTDVAPDQIGFCGETMRAAKAEGTAPRNEDPDDALPIWRRRP